MSHSPPKPQIVGRSGRGLDDDAALVAGRADHLAQRGRPAVASASRPGSTTSRSMAPMNPPAATDGRRASTATPTMGVCSRPPERRLGQVDQLAQQVCGSSVARTLLASRGVRRRGARDALRCRSSVRHGPGYSTAVDPSFVGGLACAPPSQPRHRRQPLPVRGDRSRWPVARAVGSSAPHRVGQRPLEGRAANASGRSNHLAIGTPSAMIRHRIGGHRSARGPA